MVTSAICYNGYWEQEIDVELLKRTIQVPYSTEDLRDVFSVADPIRMLNKFRRLSGMSIALAESWHPNLEEYMYKIASHQYIQKPKGVHWELYNGETTAINVYNYIKPFKWEDDSDWIVF